MSRYYIGRRYGNLPLAASGGSSGARAPVIMFGDYCGNSGLVRRAGNVPLVSSGGSQSVRSPIVVAPRGLCNPDGSLITGEYYLARRFGNINGVPVVVPVCNNCPTSGSGSGSGSGSSSGSARTSGVYDGSGGSGAFKDWCCGCPDWPIAVNMSIVTSCFGTFNLTCNLRATANPVCDTVDTVGLLPFGYVAGDIGGETNFGTYTGDVNGIDCATGFAIAPYVYSGVQYTVVASILCIPCSNGAGQDGDGWRWVVAVIINRWGPIRGNIYFTLPVNLLSCSPLVWSNAVTSGAICNNPLSSTSVCDNSNYQQYDAYTDWDDTLGCTAIVYTSE